MAPPTSIEIQRLEPAALVVGGTVVAFFGALGLVSVELCAASPGEIAGGYQFPFFSFSSFSFNSVLVSLVPFFPFLTNVRSRNFPKPCNALRPLAFIFLRL